MRVQPAPKGSRLVLIQGAEDAHEGLLREVFGIVLVTGEAVGQAVDIIGVLSHEFTPGRHIGLAGVERSGSGQLLSFSAGIMAASGGGIGGTVSGLKLALLCGHAEYLSIVRVETPATAL